MSSSTEAEEDKRIYDEREYYDDGQDHDGKKEPQHGVLNNRPPRARGTLTLTGASSSPAASASSAKGEDESAAKRKRARGSD